jgi:hypothetical protein
LAIIATGTQKLIIVSCNLHLGSDVDVAVENGVEVVELPHLPKRDAGDLLMRRHSEG